MSTENLVVQQDAFGRLVDADPETGGTGEPFASLELGKKESDGDLRFMFTFTDIGIYVDIEGWGQASYDYNEIATTPAAVAKGFLRQLQCSVMANCSCSTQQDMAACARLRFYTANPPEVDQSCLRYRVIIHGFSRKAVQKNTRPTF
ncbi:hypothetical protein IPL68_02490 [Candidatus Saccharibacteria bacterium]|nr:MAG: hypothetical protein IPL68_02490 [Candidatus Saccharibacteria bacterium]